MIKISVAAAILLNSVPALAQAPPPGFLASLHYDRDEKRVSVPVRVNGSRILWFTVDTGARHTVIDTAAAKELHLRVVSTDRMTGAGAGSVAMAHAADADVSVGDANLHVRDPWIIDLSGIDGKHQDGLIGADFFAAYAVRLDPQNQLISFYPAKGFLYRGRGAEIPLSFVDGRMFIELHLGLSNGISASHRVRVDTGSDDAVSDDLVRQSPEKRKSRQGVGLGKSYVDYSGVIDRVQIGPYTIRHSWGASNSAPAMGMEILRRFTMTFDVNRGALYLEPNTHLGDPVPAPSG